MALTKMPFQLWHTAYIRILECKTQISTIENEETADIIWGHFVARFAQTKIDNLMRLCDDFWRNLTIYFI